MDEQLDDTERRIRLKELQLALLRGDITLAEYDRRRARYAPGPTTVAVRDLVARRKVSKVGEWIGRWIKR